MSKDHVECPNCQAHLALQPIVNVSEMPYDYGEIARTLEALRRAAHSNRPNWAYDCLSIATALTSQLADYIWKTRPTE